MNSIERATFDRAVPLDDLSLRPKPRPPATSPNLVLAIVCVGICLANLDLFIVNVALPSIERDFKDASLDDMSWVLNGYAIAYAALLVFFGRLAERHRRNLSFLLGVGLFTLASAACAAANDVAMLTAFRLVQAAGAALMTPTSLGLLLAVFAPEKRGGAVFASPPSPNWSERPPRSDATRWWPAHSASRPARPSWPTSCARRAATPAG